jgi:hypothetical protein
VYAELRTEMGTGTYHGHMTLSSLLAVLDSCNALLLTGVMETGEKEERDR